MNFSDSLFMLSLWFFLVSPSLLNAQSKIKQARQEKDKYEYLEAIYYILLAIFCMLMMIAMIVWKALTVK